MQESFELLARVLRNVLHRLRSMEDLIENRSEDLVPLQGIAVVVTADLVTNGAEVRRGELVDEDLAVLLIRAAFAVEKALKQGFAHRLHLTRIDQHALPLFGETCPVHPGPSRV